MTLGDYGGDTTDATAVASEILTSKTAYVAEGKVIGTMPSRGTVKGKITAKDMAYPIQEGYHSGSGDVAISDAEQAKIIAGNIKDGVTILGVTGDYTGSPDTSDATASASEILETKTAYIATGKTIGQMPNRGAVSGTIATKSGSYTIQEGYHSGSGSVSIDSTEQNKIISSNIKKDISILGVTGTYEGIDTSDATATASDVLLGKTAYLANGIAVGLMPNQGAVSGAIATKSGVYTVPAGYHNGSGVVTIDSTEQDKILAGNIKKNVSILGVTGTYEGPDTSDATATASDILSGETAYVNGVKLTGSMNDRGSVHGTIASKSGTYLIQKGYHNGSGNVAIDSTEQAKIIAGNIRDGVSILGVTGDYAGTDTSDATAIASDILTGETAYIATGKVNGAMVNNGAVSGTIATKSGAYTVPAGYHNGNGEVSIASAEQAKIIPANIKKDVTILGITGTYEGSGGSDTSDATAIASDILTGKTAYIATGKVNGAMTNQGAVSGTISTKAGVYTVPAGYHNGNGEVTIDSTEQAKIIPANIKSGITILGITGTAPTISLTAVTPDGTNVTHYWLPKTINTLNCTATYEDKTNTRSDVYPVVAGHFYLSRFLSPYGAWCSAVLSKTTIINNTSNVTNCIWLTPVKWHSDIFFTAPLNGFLIMYKDDTSSDSFQSECYEITYTA